MQVAGKPDDARRVLQGSENALSDPPRSARREAPSCRVILLHRSQQAQVALTDQIFQVKPKALVVLGDADHQTQVGTGEMLSGFLISL